MCDLHEGHDHPELPDDLETRRSIMMALGLGAVGSVAAAAAASAAPLPGMLLAPTHGTNLLTDAPAHAMPKPLIATQSDILGPFWRAGAPFQTNLAPAGAKGQKFVMAGRVVDTDGKPVPNVVMDFWNADHSGQYDIKNPNQAMAPGDFSFRGLLKTDANGAYSVETVVPGKYRVPPKLPGFEEFDGLLRPSHVHLMTSHNGTVPLITQFYFESDPEIAKDPWAGKSKNVMKVDSTGPIWRSTFDIVLVRFGTAS